MSSLKTEKQVEQEGMIAWANYEEHGIVSPVPYFKETILYSAWYRGWNKG